MVNRPALTEALLVMLPQTGVGPGQLQSDPGGDGAGVQTLHLPVPSAGPRTGKGTTPQSLKKGKKDLEM